MTASSGLALEVYGASTVSGAAVDQYTYSGAANQKWKLTYLSNGIYALTNINSGKTLAVKGSSKAYGAAIEQDTWVRTGNEHFILSRNADGSYRIVNANSGLAVEDPAFSSAPHTVQDQWGLNGGANQRWWILKP